MMTGLTNYLWGGALALVLALFAYQEIKLHAENAAVSKELAAEIQCSKGSHCAGALFAESARGSELVAQEREAAASALAAQNAEVDKQAADALSKLQEAEKTYQRSYSDLKQSFEHKTPACDAWAKQVMPCAN